MRAKKSFDWGTGKFYFTIKSFPTNITIYRKSKEAAAAAYTRYKEAGKDVEWHGLWNGKEFVETSVAGNAAVA